MADDFCCQFFMSTSNLLLLKIIFNYEHVYVCVLVLKKIIL